MTPPIREAIEAERPDWVLVYGDTNSTLAGRARRGRGGPGRARRGGAAQLRPLDARGAKPDRGRPAVGAPLLPRRALGGAARAGGRARPARGRRRRDGATRRGSSSRSRERRARAPRIEPAVHRADDPPPGEHASPTACARSSTALNARRRADSSSRCTRARATRSTSTARASAAHVEAIEPLGYLEMLALAAQARGGRHRLGRAAEGGVLAARALRDAAAEHRVGRHGRGRREPSSPTPAGRSRAALAAARFPEDAPPLYGDGHASERIAAALYA